GTNSWKNGNYEEHCKNLSIAGKKHAQTDAGKAHYKRLSIISKEYHTKKYSEELIAIADILIEKQKYSWACFTLQQASAAALKSILSKKDESTYGDNLIKHLRLIGKHDTVPTEVKAACHNVNNFFTEARDLESVQTGTPINKFTLKDADKAKKDALAIIRYAYHFAH
ncbi:hypothetical protein DRO91_04610, partial [Candidatus Heimdallarchaeota archaeon]